MPLQAILFDLDGTIVDTERESAEAMARALRRGLGIEISQADRDFIIGRSWVDIYRNLQDRHPALRWSQAELIRETAAERVGVFADLGITVLPGAVEAVHRFAGVGRALVTGSSREEAGQVLDHLELRPAFQAVVASEDVPRSKPSPDGYLSAADKLGVAPERCVVVEDSAAGIAAGVAAGARVVAVAAGNFHGQDQSAAHAVIDTLEALTPELVEGLLR
jgi:HAD superfamily hydrolase (TIGR01509 family)